MCWLLLALLMIILSFLFFRLLSNFKGIWSQQTFVLMKTSCRRLEDVFGLHLQKTSSSRFQNAFKTFSRRPQDIFKTSLRHLQDVFKMFRKRLQDVFKISSRHLQDVFKTSLRRFENFFKTSSRRFQDVLSS